MNAIPDKENSNIITNIERTIFITTCNFVTFLFFNFLPLY